MSIEKMKFKEKQQKTSYMSLLLFYFLFEIFKQFALKKTDKRNVESVTNFFYS